MSDQYLKISEVAEKLRISERTVWNLLHDPVHPLPAFRINRKLVRVKESDLHEWMELHYRMDPRQLDTIVDDILGSLGF
ncbi:transcriptional regulator, AlpA family [Desulfacinum infernum DSM 9756]|uniref:Transcriptional regulator, AlpA family n=1 Tax=Desulfacinum infernum DSM 9756 TaxID=1121391 RepID=A0A1M5FAB5_9BACT|nr:helix-turn-helix domain-containing protein [Desulfacinum infernum]SHF88416.1 transcriptional regulator, AlpA family [Desulfacinum infernum DSM 9756]